jgi:3-phosphoshikimate 1-carboxyvinyltransferase
VKSALLLAGLAVDGATTLTEPAATRDHTERMLRAFGVTLTQKDHILKLAGQQPLQATPIAVPGDFSSAAFFLVAGCLAANPQGLLLKNVGLNPTRTGLLELLRLMGARIEVYPKESLENNQGEPRGDIRVYRSELRGIEVPPQLVPLAIDELPVFFVAAACAKGETRVTGAGELRVKESDRLAVMAAGLAALGVSVALQPDGLQLQGCEVLRGGRVASHGDHRAAMSFAVAALRAREAIVIEDVANVATSFPGFLAAANRVGLAVETL